MKDMKDPKGNSRYLRYVKAWESLPELKNWIAPIPGDKQGVFCKACQRPLYPHKKDLVQHSKTRKHILNEARLDAMLQPSRPSKDHNRSQILPLPTIKCEQMDYTVTEALNASSESKSEDRSVTIEVYPAPSERREELDHTEESILQGLTEEISTGSLTGTVPWKENPILKNWLDSINGMYYCTVCRKELKSRKTDIMKHASLKSHQFKCVKQGIRFEISAKSFGDDTDSCNRLISDSLYNYEKVIDLRSDTVTQPSNDMKDAMLAAKVGDESFEEDNNIIELQTKVATLLEKEAALIFPSGTMANLVAAMTHCWSRDSEVFLGDQSEMYEASEMALTRLGSLTTRLLKNLPDGTFDLEELKMKLRTHEESPWAITTLVCIENSHCKTGGRALPYDWLDALAEFCGDNLLVHMDGARILNAAVACGRTPADLVKYCDSVSFCLDKGLGCPFGCVLVGTVDFIERAKRIRDMLGGTMHQSGFFAAAALYSLENLTSKLSQDHAAARQIAECVADIHSSAVAVSLQTIHTNIVILHTDGIRVDARGLCDRLAIVTEEEISMMDGGKITVLMRPIDSRRVCFMTHFDLSKMDIHAVMRKLKIVIQEFEDVLKIASVKTVLESS